MLPSPVGILDVEAAVGGRALEVADDDALGADDAGGRGGSAAALDRVDRRERVAADRGVVVDDRSLSLPVGDRRAGDVRDVDEERLVRLDGGVAVDEDVERVVELSGRDRLAVSASRCSRRAAGAAVRGRDVEGDAARACAAERLTVNVTGRAGVALAGGDVVDREGGVDRRTRTRGSADCSARECEVGAVVVGIGARSGAPPGLRS